MDIISHKGTWYIKHHGKYFRVMKLLCNLKDAKTNIDNANSYMSIFPENGVIATSCNDKIIVLANIKDNGISSLE